jgi:hypothetical protein
MTPKISDTSPEAERIQIEILRAMPDLRKFMLWNDLVMACRERALAGLRERFPDADESALRRRLACVLLGTELSSKVYGPEPDPPTWSMLPGDYLEKIRATVDTLVLREKLGEYLKEQASQ